MLKDENEKGKTLVCIYDAKSTDGRLAVTIICKYLGSLNIRFISSDSKEIKDLNIYKDKGVAFVGYIPKPKRLAKIINNANNVIVFLNTKKKEIKKQRKLLKSEKHCLLIINKEKKLTDIVWDYYYKHVKKPTSIHEFLDFFVDPYSLGSLTDYILNYFSRELFDPTLYMTTMNETFFSEDKEVFLTETMFTNNKK